MYTLKKWLGSEVEAAQDKENSSVQPPSLSLYGPKDQAMLKVWGVTSAQEEALLTQLHDELAATRKLPAGADRITLRRFLRARKHSVPKAKQMYLDQLEWRSANDVDSVLTDFDFKERDRFFLYYPEGYYCCDRQGRPVYIQQPGKVNTDELWKFTTLERCVRYHIQQQEKYLARVLPAASLASGRRQEQSIVLIDMEGVGVSTLTGEVRKILGLVMEIDQDNYPELMYKTLIINAPSTFRIVWSMVRYLLDARTQAKIQVLPADYKEALQAYIAPESLMREYGGTNPAPLLSEPGPWKDAAILAELDARGSDWAAGLPGLDDIEPAISLEQQEAIAQATLLAEGVGDEDSASVEGVEWGARGESYEGRQAASAAAAAAAGPLQQQQQQQQGEAPTGVLGAGLLAG